MTRKARQMELPLFRRGGKRRGAGRKPKGARAGVSHAKRAALRSEHPALVTVKIAPGLPGLRTPKALKVLRRCFKRGGKGIEFRLVQYSIQSNHIHLLVEAREREALSRGMQGLSVRIARGLNKLWNRMGTVFADRYHAAVLTSPRQVHHALRYVLTNFRKHCSRAGEGFDPFASGYWFDGWKERRPMRGPETVARPVARALSWLLREGWKRHGLIGIGEAPRPA